MAKPSPFAQFIHMLIRTLEKKLLPRIREAPGEGFTEEYGFAGFTEGVLVFNVSWVPREEAEEKGLYEQTE